MKKFLAFGATLLLGLGAFGVANNVRRASATNGDTVHDILLSYKDANGRYTKKSEIFLNTAAVEDIDTHFHARYVSLERATYYDETADALLMGDYDGGFDDIRSGYRKNGANMEHFTYSGYADPSLENLFEGPSDYKVDNTTPNTYFVNLTGLADAAYTAHWDTFDNNGYTTYKYSVGALTVTDGAYNDATLNAFQYFTAPLLLRDNYISYNSIWVTQAASFLSIRLYASKSDAGKSTVTPGENDVLIAESRVYKGLSFAPEAKWYLKTGETKETMNVERELEYAFDAYNPEQYKVTYTFGKLDWFTIHDGGENKYGYSAIENQGWFGQDNTKPELASTILSGSHTIYWKPNTHKMYVAVPETATYTITGSANWDITASNAVFFIWIWGGYYGGGQWVDVNQNNVTFTATLHTDANGLQLVRFNDANKTTEWNRSGNVNLAAGNLEYTAYFA